MTPASKVSCANTNPRPERRSTRVRAKKCLRASKEVPACERRSARVDDSHSPSDEWFEMRFMQLQQRAQVLILNVSFCLRLRGGGDAYSSPPASPTYSPTYSPISSPVHSPPHPPESPASAAAGSSPPPDQAPLPLPLPPHEPNPASSSSSGSPPPDQVHQEQGLMQFHAFAQAVADQAYIQVMQMGFESYTPDQILTLVQWHMQVVPHPWEPPAFYVSAIVDHVLHRVVT